MKHIITTVLIVLGTSSGVMAVKEEHHEYDLCKSYTDAINTRVARINQYIDDAQRHPETDYTDIIQGEINNAYTEQNDGDRWRERLITQLQNDAHSSNAQDDIDDMLELLDHVYTILDQAEAFLRTYRQ